MARVEGVEPPTAWFVARYSIQLSYTRAVRVKTACQQSSIYIARVAWKCRTSDRLLSIRKPRTYCVWHVWHGCVEPPTACSQKESHVLTVYGACGRSRTSDRLVRSQVLYPAELHTRCSGENCFASNLLLYGTCGMDVSNLRPPALYKKTTYLLCMARVAWMCRTSDRLLSKRKPRTYCVWRVWKESNLRPPGS